MAERKRCQGLNSKCFLLTYLVIVIFLLVLWFTGTDLNQQESRVIPGALHAYITSPPRQINDVQVALSKKRVLTNIYFGGKWTLVYFSHEQCIPTCLSAFNKLAAFQSSYASDDVGVVVIDLDSDINARGKLADLLKQNNFNFPIINAEKAVIENLSKTFIALYLTTNFTDGTHRIEQQHNLFLVDPKRRIYAVFDEKLSSTVVNDGFVSLRYFYAKSE